MEIAAAETGLPRVCWSMPILCRGRIYCRSQKGEMICIDVSKWQDSPVDKIQIE